MNHDNIYADVNYDELIQQLVVDSYILNGGYSKVVFLPVTVY